MGSGSLEVGHCLCSGVGREGRKVQWKIDLHQLTLEILIVTLRQLTFKDMDLKRIRWTNDVYNIYLNENYVLVKLL